MTLFFLLHTLLVSAAVNQNFQDHVTVSSLEGRATTMVGVVDFNRDGFLDLIVSSSPTGSDAGTKVCANVANPGDATKPRSFNCDISLDNRHTRFGFFATNVSMYVATYSYT